MILFVKSWAKARDINSAYKRTLSSYGYVLMVLYYVVNIADPPIAPNLQLERGLTRGGHPDVPRNCDGFDIQFWRDEESIGRARDNGQLLPDGRRNTESIGSLLRGFFLHFSGDAPHDRFDKRHAFVWTHEVISLRVGGGRLTKQQKTWTTARTETVESKIPNVKPKEIRHNYLLCIEDPFELTHNVARTVSHDGIVAIRDEFRRAAMLIRKGGAMGDELVSLLKEYKHSELDRKPCFFGPNPANLTRRPAPRFTSPQTQKGSGSMPNRPISKINNEKATTPTKDEIVDLAPLEATDLGREVSPREPLVTSLEPENTKENAQKGSSPTGQEVDAVVEKWIAVSKFLETARQGALGRGAGQKPNQSKLRGRKKFNEHTQLKGSEVGTSYDDQFPPLGHKKRISFDEKVHNSEESETKEPNQQASPGRSILSASPKSSPAPSPPPSRQMNEVQRLRETAAVPNEFLVSAGVVKSGSSSPEP